MLKYVAISQVKSENLNAFKHVFGNCMIFSMLTLTIFFLF